MASTKESCVAVLVPSLVLIAAMSVSFPEIPVAFEEMFEAFVLMLDTFDAISVSFEVICDCKFASAATALVCSVVFKAV